MRRSFDPTVKGVILLALLVLVEAIQMVIIIGLISTFIPFKMDPANAELYPVDKSSLKPNRQIQVYHIFIMMGILAQAMGVYAFRKKLEDSEFQNNIKQLLCVDAIWVSIQCFAIFKILIYGSPSWGWGLFYTSLAASILSRIFWVEIKHWGALAGGFLTRFLCDKPVISGSFSVNAFLWTPLFILAESIQVIVVFNFIFGQIKTGNSFLSYGVFIASIGMFSFLATLKQFRIVRSRSFIIAETLITFCLLSALFKMVIYDYRGQLATNAFHILLVVAVLNKIFWPHVWSGLKILWAFITEPRNTPVLKILGDTGVVVLIILIFYMPDVQAALAKMFIGDDFIHTDTFIMAPGWAWVSGCILNVDVDSRYGLGIPIVLGSLAKWLGGYSYVNVFLAVLGVSIIYYLLCYLFLRLWLKSFFLALAAILVGIKTQMFYSLAFPQPFTYPSATPARFMFDIVFMFCIWGHLKTRRWIYLLVAAFCCGLSFFCITETGLYLAAAFYAYLVLLFIVPTLRRELYGSVKSRWMIACSVLMVPASALLLMCCFMGGHTWTKEFWDNLFEWTKYYTTGMWMGPFYGGLQYAQFWDLAIGMAFPAVYVLTILIVGTLCVLRKLPEEHLMAVVLCVYGLGAHHYYVAMATTNNYYPKGLPFVFIIFYWGSWVYGRLGQDIRRKVGAVLVAFCAYALWTNHHYLSYPNIFNFSRNPMVDPMVAETLPDRGFYFNHKVIHYPENLKLPLNSLGEKDEDLRTEKDFLSDEELKAYYERETDFSKDAGLIQSLVPPQQPVALISSWETLMLMQANRKPLFYYFQMFSSRPFRMRNFGTLEIYTPGKLKRVIDQLEKPQMPYVFMERIFLNHNVPSEYFYDNPALMGLLDYVSLHYQPYAYGKYLVAMKRIGK